MYGRTAAGPGRVLDDEVDTLTRRILFGMSGQAFARAANAIYTIGLVPLLISAWGVIGFGEWMALTALLSYAGYGSFGIVTTGGNEVIMAIGAKDVGRARLAYQMSLNVTLYILAPILLVLAFMAEFVSLTELMNLHFISEHEATMVACFALTQIWLVTVRDMMATVLYGRGRYARVYALEGAARLAELLLIAVVVYFLKGGPAVVAAVSCLVGAFDLLVIALLKRRDDSWARPDLRIFDLRWLKSQARPSIGYMLSNLTTQSVLIQGPRVALGIVSGGQAVAIYSIYSTALRLVDQIVLLFAYPLEIEVAQNYERNELSRAYQLIVLGTQFAWTACLSASAGLLILGPWIFHAWTAGRVEFDHKLMLPFMLLAVVRQIGKVSAHALVGANRIFDTAKLMLPVALLALGIGSLLGLEFGTLGMVSGAIAGELAVSLLLIRSMTAWMQRSVADFGSDLMRFDRVPEYLRFLLRRFRRSSGAASSASRLGERSADSSRRDAVSLRVSEATPDEWNRLVHRFADSNLIQTWEWGEVKSRTAPWTAERLEFVEAGEIVAIAQVLVRRLPLLLGGMAWVNRGPLWDLGRGAACVPRVLELLHRRYVVERRLYLRVASTLGGGAGFPSLPAGFQTTPAIGHCAGRLDLTRPEAELRAGLKQSWRRFLVKSEKLGTEIVVGRDEAIFGRFLAAYGGILENATYKKSTTPNLLSEFQRQLPPEGRMTVLEAVVDGEAVSWVVLATYGSVGEYLAAASLPTGRQRNCGQLLTWAAIRHLKANGFKTLDIGGFDADDRDSGVSQFKAGINPVPYRFHAELDAHPNPVTKRLIRRAIQIGRIPIRIPLLASGRLAAAFAILGPA